MSDPEALLIRGAQIADGTGRPLQAGDVLLERGMIAAVAADGALPSDGRQVLDATGQVLAPGFIDVHSHADNAPLLADDDTSKVLQGVTTEVVGNCGFSLAPVAAARRDELGRLLERLFPPVEFGWTTGAELFEALDRRGAVTNWAPLVGHNTLRVAAAGTHDRPLSEDEWRLAERLLDEALGAGAFGLSSGLIYPPGVFAATEELVGLARRMPAGRVYATHMRNEGPRLLESIEEAIEIGERAGCRIQISHLKAVGRASWGRVGAALQRLDSARAAGLSAGQDAYPYEATSTMLTTVLPAWFQDGGPDAMLGRLDDPRALARAREELAADEDVVWGAITISSTASHAHEGTSLPELAEQIDADPFDAFVHVLREERLRVSMVRFAMNEADVETVLAHPQTMIGSDGLPPGVGGRPHPRLFGTFPRVLGRYVRERGLLSLPEAIARMTSLPADGFGLLGRGRIAPGNVADLVLFDPGAVAEGGDYADPIHPPAGVGTVIQSGHLVVRDGRWQGVRRGRRLSPA
ncbi:MAG TPA: D-aminoacylase [Solirubrobacteraceae bacterium]|nr:D-aminoacylase [Solirubrobacteraceae bacterium]